MSAIPHILLFGLSATVIWGLSGMLVSATDRVAKRYHRPGFGVAFFVLGILTSISEISVAVNASIEGVPQISAGNLIGGSMVIFLLIIPLLATLGNGIPLGKILSTRTMILVLAFVLLPSLLILDHTISRSEGAIMIIMYVALMYGLEKKKPAEQTAGDAVQDVKEELLRKRKATVLDVAKISFAALLIFAAGKILVDEALFFSRSLSVPPSLMGLILLSVGTNVPELTVAIRCVIRKKTDIAFGDYLGSAAANTLIMGFLPLFNGPFRVERSEFIATFALLCVGLALFFVFSRSHKDLSRKEGGVLLGIYGVFMLIQIFSAARFALN